MRRWGRRHRPHRVSYRNTAGSREATALNLNDIVRRDPHPEPWTEGEKIPWNDPDFSRRMLAEHLSEEHDAASRRPAIIDRHVSWIHREVLHERPSRILDLGCGPGLYTSRLATLGHRCTGIDFGPASIAHAREQAERDQLDCRYILDDVRRAPFDDGHDLIMMIFGELNVFRPADARGILQRSLRALSARGTLLLEVHTYDAVRAMAAHGPRWRTSDAGLFSDRPHLRLEEAHWDEEQRVTIERYYLIDAGTAEVSRYSASVQAYTPEAFERLIASAGFQWSDWHPAWPGIEPDDDFRLLLARRGQPRPA